MGTDMEIQPVSTAAEAVEQGARLLDEVQPGWERTVNGAMTEGIFRMWSWETCMVGTLELWRDKNAPRKWGNEYISFNGLSFRADSQESRYVGFLPLDDMARDAFVELDALWREQVEDRLSPPDQP